jgi:methionyl-tRNA formyltransferase
MRLTASAVGLTAERLGLPLFKPQTLRDAAAVQALRDAGPDIMVVAAYGLILPREVLGIPPGGCVNIHASLLPRWRGAAPIQRAILAGDVETGISIMQMDAGLDTGDVLVMERLAIGRRDTTGSLTEALAGLGCRSIVDTLSRLQSLTPAPQDASRATYAAKIAKSEARIDWAKAAVDVDRQIRAFNPFPGAETRLGSEVLKIWEALPVHRAGNPGEVLEAGTGCLVIACAEGSIDVRTVQRPGGKRVSAADFLRGAAVAPGTIFEGATSKTR